jgi:DNA polymerase
MRINHNLKDLLDWYTEIGIDMAVSNQSLNRFASKSSQKPIFTSGLNPIHQHAVTPPDMPLKKIQNTSSQDIASKCQTLEELKSALSAFEGCELKLTATNLVFSDGNPKARIMVVGEAPGADEDRQGLPFVGLSGQLLDKIFASIGLDRTKIYITNIIPWRPPGNRQPTTQEITLCQPFVERHIELVQPEFLILVGGVSAKTILRSSEGITKLRGRWQSFKTERIDKPIKTLATFHPAFLLRSPAQKAQVWKDMLLLKKELEK